MFLTVNARPLRRWMSQTDNRRRASSALPSHLLNININTAESGSAMSSAILATLQHKKRIQRIDEGQEDPVKEFVHSVRFDIESEAQQKLERAVKEKYQNAHKVKRFYKPTSCKISIQKGRGLQKY